MVSQVSSGPAVNDGAFPSFHERPELLLLVQEQTASAAVVTVNVADTHNTATAGP